MEIPDLDKWNPKWYWDISQPLPGQGKKKNKKQQYRYSVYISNGETIFTPEHVALFVDGDNLPELIQQAHDQLLDGIAKKKVVVSTYKKANDLKKKHYLCKNDKGYFGISEEKYKEKNMSEKIIEEVHPER